MDIRIYPDPALRQPADKIEKITPEIQDLAKKMIEIMRESNGIGLAATQVGVNQCLFVVDVDPENQNTPEDLLKNQVFINPEIISKSGKVLEEEGCLSFPGLFATTTRPGRISMRAQDIDGNEVTINIDGVYAKVIDHEVDHLNGVLFIDKLTPASRQKLSTQIKKMQDKAQK